MKKKLIDVGQGVKMTEPVKVEKGLRTGGEIHASLSHQGIFAICDNSNDIIQFTNLNTNRQVKIKVEWESITGFYDSMLLLLTDSKPLREASVEEVFNNPRKETFRKIEGTSNVDPSTDVSLLHERRVLYYHTNYRKLFAFNVDTRVNTEINIGKRIYTIASFAGIDCGVKIVFQDLDDRYTYILNNDNSVTKISEGQRDSLTAIFPSASNPKNIKDAVFKYYRGLFDNDFIKCGNWININDLIKFEDYYSVVRIYKDIFLACDRKTESWVLVRILVP